MKPEPYTKLLEQAPAAAVVAAAGVAAVAAAAAAAGTAGTAEPGELPRPDSHASNGLEDEEAPLYRPIYYRYPENGQSICWKLLETFF